MGNNTPTHEYLHMNGNVYNEIVTVEYGRPKHGCSVCIKMIM